MKDAHYLRSSGKNLYASLYEHILTQIQNGDYPSGSSLPTEKWLSEHFNVSRVTVRRALDALARDGIIVKEKGKSPTVPQKIYNRSFNKLYSFSEQMNIDGHKSSARILELKTIKAEPLIARKMHLEPDTEITYIKRIRYSDEDMIAIQDIYLNNKYAGNLTVDDLSGKSLYSVLEKKGVIFDYADQFIFARMPTAEQKKLLDLNSRTPVFITERITYHRNGDVIEYVDTCTDSSRFSINIQLMR